ncbi:11400_t:CDS:2, partial [Acaulospora colombiana]
MDIQKACKELLSRIEQIDVRSSLHSSNASKEQVVLLNSLLNSDIPQNDYKILNVVSELLLHPLLTLSVSELFRPILIDLVSRWLLPNEVYRDDMMVDKGAVFHVERVALAFSKLLPVSVSFFSRSPSLLLRLDSMYKSPTIEEVNSSAVTKDIKCLLTIAYQLLRFSARTFVPLWNWSSLFQLLTSSDESIRYLAIQCISIVFEMSNAQREIARQIWVFPKGGNVFIDWKDIETCDIRMLTLLEQGSIARQQISLYQNGLDDSALSISSELEKNLSSLTVNISGILLPRSTRPISVECLRSKQRIVMTETTQKNLSAICFAISVGLPVLLEGETGSGKTALVEEIAIATGRDE